MGDAEKSMFEKCDDEETIEKLAARAIRNKIRTKMLVI